LKGKRGKKKRRLETTPRQSGEKRERNRHESAGQLRKRSEKSQFHRIEVESEWLDFEGLPRRGAPRGRRENQQQTGLGREQKDKLL